MRVAKTPIVYDPMSEYAKLLKVNVLEVGLNVTNDLRGLFALLLCASYINEVSEHLVVIEYPENV